MGNIIILTSVLISTFVFAADKCLNTSCHGKVAGELHCVSTRGYCPGTTECTSDFSCNESQSAQPVESGLQGESENIEEWER